MQPKCKHTSKEKQGPPRKPRASGDLTRHDMPHLTGDLPYSERLTMLSGQISLLRRRCEEELPITLEALANAERLAKSLQLNGVAI